MTERTAAKDESAAGSGKTDIPDPAQLWRTWLSETERQWNEFLNTSMATDEYSGQLSRFMDLYLFNLKNMSEIMGRFLMAVNVPTRTDVLEIGERLLEVEARLAAIEAQLHALAGPKAATRKRAPRRTKVHPDASASSGA